MNKFVRGDAVALIAKLAIAVPLNIRPSKSVSNAFDLDMA
jgi:hypothetical protein